MWKKSLSNKIARVFEVVGYILLIPTIPIVLVSAVFIFSLVISVPVFGMGLTLFVGYIKHSRGNLDESKVAPLWISTFLFNFIPLVMLTIKYYLNAAGTLRDINFLFAVLILWWLTACCLSLTALYDELKFGDGLS